MHLASIRIELAFRNPARPTNGPEQVHVQSLKDARILKSALQSRTMRCHFRVAFDYDFEPTGVILLNRLDSKMSYCRDAPFIELFPVTVLFDRFLNA